MKQENPEKTILAMEKEALDRWSSGNPVGYVDRGAEDMTYFDDIGAQSRISGIDQVRKYLSTLEGQIPEHRYELVDPAVQVYGEIGIVTLRYHPSLPSGEALPSWKATSIYSYTADRWQMVHAHWSMIKEA